MPLSGFSIRTLLRGSPRYTVALADFVEDRGGLGHRDAQRKQQGEERGFEAALVPLPVGRCSRVHTVGEC